MKQCGCLVSSSVGREESLPPLFEKYGRWFLACNVSSSAGEEELYVPLFAKCQADAERQAMIAAEFFEDAAKIRDHEFFQNYCKSIKEGEEGEDSVEFSNFRLVYRGQDERAMAEKYEKKMAIRVPRLDSGPRIIAPSFDPRHE